MRARPDATNPEVPVTSGLSEIRKTIELDAPLERAFEVWTGHVGHWWPLAEHSIAKADATGCFIEPGIGGRLYETTRTGDEHLWATISVWIAHAMTANLMKHYRTMQTRLKK
jgi:hypothetical protein